MIYVCEKCGYKTDKKASYTKHLNRKTPCKRKTVSDSNSDVERYVEPREQSDEQPPNDNVDDESGNNPVKILKISEDMLVDMMILYYHSYKMMERKYGQEFVEKERPNLRRLVDELLKIED